MARSCEDGNETSGSVKSEEFLDYLEDYSSLYKILLYEISC